MSTQTSDNNKRIAKNTLFLYFRMLFMMAVSLYTSRIILKALGVEDFGIYNVVGGFVTMFTYITGSMSTATQRFITFALGKKDYVGLKKVFSMAISIHIGMAILLLIVGEIVGLWLLYNKMIIPDGRMNAAFWVLQCSLLSTVVMVISIPYNALIISHEKMSAFAYISILEVTLKLLLVFTLLVLPADKLICYAIFLLCVQVLLQFIYSIYSRRHFEESKYQRVWDKQLFKDMSSFAGWSMFGCLAGAGQTQGLNILLNVFFGPAVNAARGVAVQVQNAINGFARNFQMSVNPQITKNYASGELEYMNKLIYSSSKFSVFLLFMLSLPVILEAHKILQLWLGIVPDHTVAFIRFILVISMFEALANPVICAVQATKKIRKYQIVAGSCLMLTLPVSYLFLKLGGQPEVVFATHLCVAFLTQVFRIYLVRELMFFPLFPYIRKVVCPILSVCSLSFVAALPILYMMDEGFLRLLITAVTSVLLCSIFILVCGLTAHERISIFSFIKKKFHK